MSWSKVAFGAVKCAKGVVEHETALTTALKGGITGLNRRTSLLLLRRCCSSTGRISLTARNKCRVVQQ